jgi:hypothetical protein
MAQPSRIRYDGPVYEVTNRVGPGRRRSLTMNTIGYFSAPQQWPIIRLLSAEELLPHLSTPKGEEGLFLMWDLLIKLLEKIPAKIAAIFVSVGITSVFIWFLAFTAAALFGNPSGSGPLSSVPIRVLQLKLGLFQKNFERRFKPRQSYAWR